eukprot:g32273.t1
MTRCALRPEDFHPGQHLVLQGLGRASTDRYVALVVDVRRSDESVKVRYIHGEFKRFCLGELEMLMPELALGDMGERYLLNDSGDATGSREVIKEEQEPERWENWSIGQHIYLTGSGKWWSGRNFGATIVDIRHSDATVKVQYTSGGFKRFPMMEFKQLVTDQIAIPEMWEDWSSSSTPELTELDRLHDEIVQAIRTGTGTHFMLAKAAELEAKYHSMLSQGERIQDLQVALGKAVKEANYLKAHWIQQELQQMGAADASVPAPLPEVGLAFGLWSVFRSSTSQALCGGVAGASAMALQITSLMWLRTIMNYQYRYGMTMREAMRDLYVQGGLPRFYRGIGPALVQGPLMRFVDSSANAGVLAFFQSAHAENWPVWIQTIFASASAASLRIALMPLDAVKTVLQVDGHHGLAQLFARCRAGRGEGSTFRPTQCHQFLGKRWPVDIAVPTGGSSVLFRGAMASSAATFVSHYPWFTVFNCLNRQLPQYEKRSQQLLRNAGIGFCASVCSDTVSNSLRVLKTHRQTHDQGSYLGIAQAVIRTDGVTGLLSRGLTTRIIANGLSGMVFSVLYRLFEEPLVKR